MKCRCYLLVPVSRVRKSLGSYFLIFSFWSFILKKFHCFFSILSFYSLFERIFAISEILWWNVKRQKGGYLQYKQRCSNLSCAPISQKRSDGIKVGGHHYYLHSYLASLEPFSFPSFLPSLIPLLLLSLYDSFYLFMLIELFVILLFVVVLILLYNLILWSYYTDFMRWFFFAVNDISRI